MQGCIKVFQLCLAKKITATNVQSQTKPASQHRPLHRSSQPVYKHTISAFKLPNSTSKPGSKYHYTSQLVLKYHNRACSSKYNSPTTHTVTRPSYCMDTSPNMSLQYAIADCHMMNNKRGFSFLSK